MNKNAIETNRFAAISDNGKIYTVVEFQKITHDPTLEPPRRLVTEKGYPVKNIDAETFMIIQTNEIIRKV